MADGSSSIEQNLRLKCRKHSEEKIRDKITSLPNDLLCQILSFLPTTEEVVRTGILSSRWRYLWTGVHNLYFKDKSKHYSQSSKKWKEFVDRVMLLHNVPCIHKFCLCSQSHHETSAVNTWIRWICGTSVRNIEQLKLSLYLMETIKLPPMIYNSEKLVVLKLRGDINLNVPAFVCFPSLKILRLRNLSYFSGDSIGTILSGSPVLEDFALEHDGSIFYGKESILEIRLLSLKKLVIRGDYNVSGKSPRDASKDREIQDIYLYTPKLEVLKLKHVSYYSPKVFDLAYSLSSLVEADIDIFSLGTEDVRARYFAEYLVELLIKISESTVKVLRLASRVLENIVELPNLNLEFHIFGNLTHLDVQPYGKGWMIFPTMLECTPNLDVLVINMTHNDFILWSTPEVVPQCVLRLRTIEVKAFRACKKGMKMMEFFLESSMALEKMIINLSKSSFVNPERKKKISESLLMFPRASSTCHVVLSCS